MARIKSFLLIAFISSLMGLNSPAYQVTSKDKQDKKDKKKEQTFFGITAEAFQVIYVIDISDSMKAPMVEPADLYTPTGDQKEAHNLIDKTAPKKVKDFYKNTFEKGKVVTRMDMLKKEFARSIFYLDESVSFTIIIFHTEAEEWSKKNVRATWDNKMAALEYIYKLNHKGMTAMFSAIEKALHYPKKFEPKKEDIETGKKPEFKPEELTVIYMLTDGMPTKGRFVKEPKVKGDKAMFYGNDAVAWLEEELKKLKAVFHVIAIGELPDNQKGFYQHMEKMAQVGNGIYKHLTDAEPKKDKDNKKDPPKKGPKEF